MMNMSQEQQGFYHRESPRSGNSLYGTFPHKYYNHILHNSNISTNHLEKIPLSQTRGIIYEGSLLSFVIMEQTIIWAALSSVETFDSTKSKFKCWTESIENAAQVFGQDTWHIAFSKMIGSPLSLANTVKAQSPNLTWMELKRELSMQYLLIPYDSHATQAVAQLEQGPHELLDMYLDHASELLSKIYHTSDMSRILAEGLSHYTVVYCLNCRRLKGSVVGHPSTQWKMMEDCFRDIHNIGAGYEKAKGNCRAEYNT